MYNYIDFDFNFTFNKAMKEKVPGDRGDLLSARVSEILIVANIKTAFKDVLNNIKVNLR